MRACVRSNTGEGEGEGAMREGGGIYRRKGCVFVCSIRVFKCLVKKNRRGEKIGR